MDMATALLVILTLGIVILTGVIVVLIVQVRRWQRLIKRVEGQVREGAEQMSELKLFDQLPKDRKDAVNRIVGEAPGNE